MVGRNRIPAQTALLLVLALAAGFLFQGTRGLYETTEGRYAEVGREMAVSGDWLVPTLDGRPHLTKPPLTYWTIAASIEVFGAGTWAPRLPGALAFFLSVLLVAAIGRALFDRPTGTASGLVYASSLLPAMGCATVSTDMTLAMWELTAVLCYVLANRPEARRPRLLVNGMWLAFGLAFLTKGPPGLLPLAGLLAFHLLARRPARRIVVLEAIPIFAVVGLSWFSYVSLTVEGQFGRFWSDEILGRVAGDALGRNTRWYKGPVVYVPTILLGMGAWLVAGIGLIHARKLYLPSTLKERIRERGPAAFLLLWFTIPFLVFLVARSRLPLYVLPIYAPVALAIGRFLARSARVPVVALVMVIAIVALKAAAPLFQTRADMKALHGAIEVVAPEDTNVVIFGKANLHGLAYYQHGRVLRMVDQPDCEWADFRTKEFAERARSGRWLIVVRTRWADALTKRLQRDDLTFTRHHLDDFDLLVLQTP
jgi:4-amino-4-deoxy-L-arabinose transferase